MTSADFKQGFTGALLLLLCLLLGAPGARASAATEKQQALDQWRNLTSPTSSPPRVFVKGDRVQFYFHGETNVVEFDATWSRRRVPTDGYKVNSALLRRGPVLSSLPERPGGWREAAVIAGAEWRRLATNLLETLTPKTPAHGVYYEAFLADGVLYRDAQGAPRFAPDGQQPGQVIIDHRFTIEETLDILAWRIEEHLAQSH